MASSLVLGHSRERYQRLRVPVLLHGLFNLTWLLAGLDWQASPDPR